MTSTKKKRVKKVPDKIRNIAHAKSTVIIVNEVKKKRKRRANTGLSKGPQQILQPVLVQTPDLAGIFSQMFNYTKPMYTPHDIESVNRNSTVQNQSENVAREEQANMIEHGVAPIRQTSQAMGGPPYGQTSRGLMSLPEGSDVITPIKHTRFNATDVEGEKSHDSTPIGSSKIKSLKRRYDELPKTHKSEKMLDIVKDALALFGNEELTGPLEDKYKKVLDRNTVYSHKKLDEEFKTFLDVATKKTD